MSQVAVEDRPLAALLKTKVLSCQHVFTWDPRDLEGLFEDIAASPISRIFDFISLTEIYAPRSAAVQWARALEVKLSSEQKSAIASIPAEGYAAFSEAAASAKLLSRIRELERTGAIDLQEIDPPKSMTTTFLGLSRVA